MADSAGPSIIQAADALGAQELLDALAALQRTTTQLVEIAEAKLVAARHADAAGLTALATRERLLLQQYAMDEQKRRAAVTQLAQGLRRPHLGAAPLRELLGYLPGSATSAVTARAAGLRRQLEQLQQKNALFAAVARGLQEHIRAIFADVAKVQQESIAYGPNGRHAVSGTRSWVEAVG